MELNTLLQYKPYSTARTEKRALYAGLLTGLTQFHRERCPEYGRLLDALGKKTYEAPEMAKQAEKEAQ